MKETRERKKGNKDIKENKEEKNIKGNSLKNKEERITKVIVIEKTQ